MKRLMIVCAFFSIGIGVFAQSKSKPGSIRNNQDPGKVISDIVNGKTDSVNRKAKSAHKKMIQVKDTLVLDTCSSCLSG